MRRESELQHFFETALDGVQVVSADGTVKWCNGAMRELLCVEAPGDYCGQHVGSVFETRRQADELLATLARTGSLTDAQAALRTRDGAVKYVQVRARVYAESDGTQHSRWFVRDVTPRVLAEQEQERQLTAERVGRTEAERLNQLKDKFLAVLSHELRTPLNAILGWTQLLTSSAECSREVQEGLAVIDRQARVQLRLVSELLDISRAVTGRLTLSLQPLLLRTVLMTAVDSGAASAHLWLCYRHRSVCVVNGDMFACSSFLITCCQTRLCSHHRVVASQSRWSCAMAALLSAYETLVAVFLRTSCHMSSIAFRRPISRIGAHTAGLVLVCRWSSRSLSCTAGLCLRTATGPVAARSSLWCCRC